MGQTLSSLHLHHHQPAACLNLVKTPALRICKFLSASPVGKKNSHSRVLLNLVRSVGWVHKISGVTVCPNARPLSGKLTTVGKQTFAVPTHLTLLKIRQYSLSVNHFFH